MPIIVRVARSGMSIEAQNYEGYDDPFNERSDTGFDSTTLSTWIVKYASSAVRHYKGATLPASGGVRVTPPCQSLAIVD
jgi:hypothetical protein